MEKRMLDESKLSEIQERFADYCAQFNIELTGSYHDEEVAKRFIEALSFWKGIRLFDHFLMEVSDGDDSFQDCDESSVKEQILKINVGSENELIALVSKVELMPSRVFRRALWFYNIDFQSFEAFLRRLQPEQVEGLERAYNSYVEGEAPECFTKGFKNKVRRLFNSNWTKSIFDSGQDNHFEAFRYQAKGAIAYEFFGIDFGHALFRNESDTCSVQGNRSQRFFSKDKIDDFVVNQEDGAYWWLYRTIRSNSIWNTKKNVQLKPAICPGFWVTLLAWLYVLVGSPMLFIAGLLGAATQGSFEFAHILLIILGSFTPLVTVIWLCKTGFRLSKNFVKNKLGIEVDDHYLEIIGVMVGVAIGGTFISVLTVWFWILMYEWCYESVILATWLTASMVLYVAFSIRWKGVPPWKFKVIGPATMLFVAGKLAIENRELLWSVALWALSFLQTYWVSLALVCLYLCVPFGLLAWTDSVRSNNTRVGSGSKRSLQALDRASAIFEKIAIVSVLLVLVIPVVAMVLNPDLLDKDLVVFLAVGSPLVTIAVISYLWTLIGSGGRKTYITYLPKLLDTVGHLSPREVSFFRKLSSNTWLHSQSDYVDKATRLHRFVREWFSFEDYPEELVNIDEKGFARLGEYEAFFTENFYFNEDKRKAYVEKMLLGVSPEEAERLLDMARVRRRERKEATIAFYSKTLGRLISPVVSFVAFVVGWIVKIWNDSVYLWKSFNEACPYWRRSKRLDLES